MRTCARQLTQVNKPAQKLSFLSWNVDGLWNKLSDPDFLQFLNKHDVVCLFETFLENIFVPPASLCDFECFSFPAVKLSHHGRRSGGVVVLVKTAYAKYVSKVNIACDQTVLLKMDGCLFGTERDVLLVASYVPPKDSPFYSPLQYDCLIEELEQCLASAIEQFGDIHLLLCGDFNGRTSDLQPNPDLFQLDPADTLSNNFALFEHTRCTEDMTVNPFGRKLLDLCACFELVILNGFCSPDVSKKLTFISTTGCSINDYFISSPDFASLCDKLVIGDRVESPHMPLILTVTSMDLSEGSDSDTAECDYQHVAHEKITWEPSELQTLVDNFSSPEYQNQLVTATALVDHSIDDALNVFTNAVKGAASCMTRHFGSSSKNTASTIAKAGYPWYDKECRHAKAKTRKCLRNFRKQNSPENKLLYVTERKRYKNLLKTKEQMYKKDRVEKLLSSRHDQQAFWKEIRSCRPKRNVRNNISNEAWLKHFSDVLNDGQENQNNACEDLPPEIEQTDDPFNELNADISEAEVKEAIRHAKSGKAPGPDGIISEILKASDHGTVVFLTKFFNTLFCKGLFPTEWSKAIIFPLHKKGDANNPDNYRGISLLSCVSKLYTHILNKRLTQWAEDNNIISEEQAGFRKTYSTVDHIFTLYAVVQKNLLQNKKVYVAFVDFRKAFDTVKRNVLWNILLKTGISGRMLSALTALYQSVQFCVRNSMNNCTDYFECFQGLKQGCLVSPTLFSFLINELAVYVVENGKHGFQLRPDAVELFLLMFADDIALFSSTPYGLQTQLNNLHTAASKLGLCVNLEKTKIIVFRNGGYLSRFEKWTYGTEQVEVVNMYKYLGMNFTTRLSTHSSVEDLATKAKKSAIDIFKSLWKINCFSPEIFFKLFDAQIAPILLYASEIWGTENCAEIERVHTFACKKLLNASPRTPNQMVYGELGRYPLSVLASVRCVSYWLRLCTLPTDRYASQAYHMLKDLDEKGKQTWASKVRTVLFQYGFGYVWIEQSVGNRNAFLKEFRQRLTDCFQQDWSAKLADSDRYSLYRTFKYNLVQELYFDAITSRHVRNMYIKFRLGITDLRCNKLRYRSANMLATMCPLCNNAPEDELHFMFDCPAYDDLRQKHLSTYDLVFSRSQKLAILNNPDRAATISLARYVYYAFNLRRDMLALSV